MPQVTDEFLKDVTDHVAQAGELLDKAAQVETEIAKRTPSVVENMVAAGWVSAEKKANATVNLQDPLKMLETLNNVALQAVQQKQAAAKNETTASLGAAVEPTVKTASATPARRTSAADEKFLRDFGLSA